MVAHHNNAVSGTLRWAKAQAYERSYWERLGDDIEAGVKGQLDWYAWRAGQLESRFASLQNPPPRAGKVLEIGSGPIGIVNFLDWKERYAVDPLERFYRTRPALVGLRDPAVKYMAGTGEELAFDDGMFSLVIIDNVLDHTYEPGKILAQIERILRFDGCLYLAVNVHTRWGALLHELLAVLQIDEGHPYTFTGRTLRRLLTEHGFAILSEQVEDYRAAARENRRSRKLTDRIKGYSGLSEFSHSVLCGKQAFSAHGAGTRPEEHGLRA
jgi:SAM-dependent methyltransferase